MYLLAKLAALAIAVWFYMTADKAGQPPVKWVIIGLIGYLMAYLIGHFALEAALAKKGSTSIIATQLPALFGLVAAYFIRKKLLSNTVH